MIGQFISDLTEFQFLQIALLSLLLISITSSVIGSFAIVSGNALQTDALGHAVIPGVVLSMIFKVPILIGALVFGFLANWLISKIQLEKRFSKDVSIGIVLATFFSIGTVIVYSSGLTRQYEEILFGNVLSVSKFDLVTILLISIAIVTIVYLNFKKLKLVAFDPDFAKSIGLSVEKYQKLLMIVSTIGIILAIKSVGVILVSAFVVTNSASSRIFSHSFSAMINNAAIIGVINSILGLFISYSFDLPAGPTIILLDGVLFFILFLFRRVS
ncbi:MAG: metal ABC transporter permease [Lactobacillaceae bacterium]|jgi:iron/zinc/copper transport system permease protein|nr:metal ABC transporter permease [Lactobacillaceae bacterium]